MAVDKEDFAQWKRERERKVREAKANTPAFASHQQRVQQTRSPSLQQYFQNEPQYYGINTNNQVSEDFCSPLCLDTDVSNENNWSTQQKSRPSSFFQQPKQALGSIRESNQEEEEEEQQQAKSSSINQVHNYQELFQGYFGNQKPNLFREELSRSISNSTLSAKSIGFNSSNNSPHTFSEEISFSPPLTPAESKASTTPLSTASSTIRKAFGSFFTNAFSRESVNRNQASSTSRIPTRSGFRSSTMTQRQSKFSSIDVNASFFSNGKKKKTFIVQTFPLWSKVMILICCIIGLSGFFIREILEIIGPYAGVSFSKVENEKMKIRLEILRKEIHSFQEVATQVEEHSQKVFDEMISHVNKMKETREQQQIILTTGIEQIKHDVIEYTVQIVKTPPKIPPKTPPLPQQQQQQQVQEIEKQKKKKQTIADALDLAAEEALEQFLSKENLDTLNDLDFHFEPIPKELEKAMINEKKSTNTAQVVIDTFSKPQVEESTEKAQQTITSNINTTTTTSIKSIIVGFLKKLQVVLIFFVTFTIALFMYDGNLRRDLKRRFFISSRTSRNNRFTRAYDSSEVETVRNSFSEDSETEDSATAEDDDVHNTTFIADLDDDENVDTYTSQRYNDNAYGRKPQQRNSRTTGQVPVRRSRRVIERTPPRF